MIVVDSTDQLYAELGEASRFLRNSKSVAEKIALSNYIGNVCNSICSVNDMDINFLFDKKQVFQNSKNYHKFLKKVDIFENRMLEHFILKKNFHNNFVDDVLAEVIEDVNTIVDEEFISSNVLTENDFYTMERTDLQPSLYLCDNTVKRASCYLTIKQQ